MKKRLISLTLSVLLLLSLIPMKTLAEDAMEIVPIAPDDTEQIIKPWYPNADGGLGYNSTKASGEEIFNAMLEQSKSGEPDSFNDDTLTPYGTQKGELFTMLEKLELFEYISDGNTFKSGSIMDDLTYGTGDQYIKAVTQSVSGIAGLRFARGIAFDPTGCGQKNHVAIIGFQDNGTNTSGDQIASFHLYIIDAETKKEVEHIQLSSDGTYSPTRYGNLINELTIVDSSNVIQITAGDYNGDGHDSLIIYDSLGLWEVSHPTNFFQTNRIDTTSNGKSYCNDAYKSSNLSDSWQLRNQLCMALASEDVNGDGIDDLIALSYTGDISSDYVNGDKGKLYNTTCIPQLSVGYGRKGTALLVSDLSIDKVSVSTGPSNGITTTLACPGVAVGDIDGDGENEIITAGYLNKSKTTDVVNVDDSQSANPVAYAYYKSSGAGKLQRVGDIRELPRASTSPIAKDDSLREKEYLFQQLSVECVALDGMHTKEYVFLSGWFYYMNSSSKALEPIAGNEKGYDSPNYVTGYDNPFRFLTENLTDSNNKKWDVDEVFVLSASVGNYFPKVKEDNGREGIAVIIGYKSHTDANKEGDYNFKEVIIWGNDSVTGTGTNKLTNFIGVGVRSPMYYYSNGEYSTDDFVDVTRGNAGVVLCGVDVGSDTVVAKYSGKQYAYTDPTVVAFLQAAPYFSELEAGNSSTQYSYSEGYRVTQGTSTEVSYDVGFAMSAEAGPVQMSMDTGVAYELNEEFVSSIDKTYTTTFEANDQNQVILRQTLMYYYFYDVGFYNETTGKYEFKEKLIVSAPQYPVLTSVSMDQYNELAAAYNKKVDESTDSNVKKEHKMALITDALKEEYFLNNEGNPFAYASSASDYKDNGIPGWDLSKAEVGATDTWMKLSHAGGTQSQAYSVTLEEEKTKSVAEGCFVNMTLMVGGGAFGFSAYAGATAGYERLDGSSYSTASMTSTETSGTVQNLTSDLTDYGFDWKLIGWKTDDLFPGVPFVGYAVKNQKDLPQPVDDLKATYNADDQTVTLTFTAPETEPGRMAATHFYAYDDLHDGYYIGACNYSSTDPNCSITIDVSGYTAQSATFTVIPYNETYNMRGMPSNEAYCLFVMSSNVVSNLIQELRDKIAALETALKKEDADLADDIADLIEAYKAADAKLQSQVDDLEEAQDALKKAMEEADAALQAAIDQVKADLTKAIDDLSKATAGNLAEAVDNLTTAYTNADALLKAEIDGNLADLEGKMNEADAALQAAIDQVRTDLSNAIDNLRNATDENLTEAVDNLTTAYTNADALLKADIDSLSEALAALEKTMIEADKALLAAIEKVQADLDASRKELESAMAEEVERLNEKIDMLNAALDAAYKLADETLKKNIDELNAQHQEDIDALRAELEAQHKEDIDALRAELEALKAQIADQDEINNTSIQDLNQVDSTHQESLDTNRTIAIIALCIGAISLLGNGALLFLLRKKSQAKV
ncbi:MAG: hypothetical protein ACI4PO_02330 [Faecousia sp.]